MKVFLLQGATGSQVFSYPHTVKRKDYPMRLRLTSQVLHYSLFNLQETLFLRHWLLIVYQVI
jgi:hypothetical protein